MSTAEPIDIKAAADRFVRWRRDRQRRPPVKRKRAPLDASGYVDGDWDDLELH